MHALHAAVLHFGQAVGVFEDAIVVRDDDDTAVGVPRDVAQQVHDVAAGILVEGTGRLIANHQARLMHEGARDGHALLLATGEIGRSLVPAAGQTQLGEHRLGAALGLAAGGIGVGADGNARGVMIGGIGVGVGGTMRGLIAGGLGAGADAIEGGALAVLGVGARRIHGGVVTGGVLHIAEGGSFRGVSLNATGSHIKGVQHGITIGLVNYARRVDGFQVGLLTIIGDAKSHPILPLVNWQD